MKNIPGDRFFIRANFSRTPEGEGELDFHKDDILVVEDTVHHRTLGLWLAWLVDDHGNKIRCGSIPSRFRWRQIAMPFFPLAKELCYVECLRTFSVNFVLSSRLHENDFRPPPTPTPTPPPAPSRSMVGVFLGGWGCVCVFFFLINSYNNLYVKYIKHADVELFQICFLYHTHYLVCKESFVKKCIL